MIQYFFMGLKQLLFLSKAHLSVGISDISKATGTPRPALPGTAGALSSMAMCFFLKSLKSPERWFLSCQSQSPSMSLSAFRDDCQLPPLQGRPLMCCQDVRSPESARVPQGPTSHCSFRKLEWGQQGLDPWKSSVLGGSECSPSGTIL